MSDLADSIRRALEARPEVVFAYLFGSRAHGTSHARADVDVAVYVRRGTEGWPLLDLTRHLQEALGRDDVDVVVLNDAPPALAFEALRGTLVLSRDEGERVEAEAWIMMRYHDRLPYLRRSLDEAMRGIRKRGLT